MYSARRRQGFTLVELLVVIGIIALLISILLPSLSAAKRQAATVKCLSNLRQIGNAFAMYANDNKGMWPVSVWRDSVRSNDWFYDTDNPATSGLRNWYWHMFIQKYLNSKAGRNAAGQTTGDLIEARDYIEKNNILWGCPEWRPWNDSSFTGGINLDEVGYGMNWNPTYRADFPSTANPDTPTSSEDGTSYGPTVQPAWSHMAYRQMVGGNKPGHFFKQVEWKNAAERGLVCDSEYFTPALDGPPTADGTPLPQPPHLYQDYGAYNLDFFRHGRAPNHMVATGAVTKGYGYDMHTGKVGINMLFCDGHAATLISYGDVYKALRMKYP